MRGLIQCQQQVLRIKTMINTHSTMPK